jgi:hypothetical protein
MVCRDFNLRSIDRTRRVGCNPTLPFCREKDFEKTDVTVHETDRVLCVIERRVTTQKVPATRPALFNTLFMRTVLLRLAQSHYYLRCFTIIADGGPFLLICRLTLHYR